MKVICLDTQDCGHVKKLSYQEVKDFNPDAPFSKCELCGYYALTVVKDLPEDLNLKIYAKLLKNFEET